MPPALSALGMALLIAWVRCLQPALTRFMIAGAALVILGGTLKVSWKLLWVTTQVDHSWMSAGLFWCMGPGFAVLAGTVLALSGAERRGQLRLGAPWIAISLAAIGVLTAWTGTLPDKVVMLGMTVLGNLVFMVVLIILSSRRRLYAAAGLLVTNIVITFVLAGLARIPEQTAALQWIEEILNAFAQGAFAWAAWMLWQRATRPLAQKT